MEKDLNYLTAEKEVQYAKMEDAIRLMQDLNFLNFNRFAEQEARLNSLNRKFEEEREEAKKEA
jgi:hypothetical protein